MASSVFAIGRGFRQSLRHWHAQHWYRRYGRWSLLLSWVPIIGDPLTIAAGVLREPFPVFLLLVATAKIGRYLVLAGIVLNWV